MLIDLIPPNSTVTTGFDRLTHPRKYVAAMLSVLRKRESAQGNSHVKIGITGSGQKPYYRVFSVDEDGQEEIFGSFYDNHDPLGVQAAQTSNWRSRSLTHKEVEDFLADRTGYSGSRPKRN